MSIVGKERKDSSLRCICHHLNDPEVNSVKSMKESKIVSCSTFENSLCKYL